MLRTQYVEIFHLLFIRHLEQKLDKNLYAIKGGCNLRFFFKSIRYSEDIDFDIRTIAPATLRNKINKLLESVALKQSLKSNGIEIVKISESKQTETTQRWKISLKVAGESLPLATKIEFSRRQMNNNFKFETIDNEIIQLYKLYPIVANHYTREEAFNQKVNALINRTETQARDIFDLNLLLDSKIDLRFFDQSLKNDLETAIANLGSISFTDFKGQVVAYLMSEYQNYYDTPKTWEDIKNSVTAVLRALQS